MAIKAKADIAGIHTSLIEEDGYVTALGIGPASDEEMNQFKYLPLL